MFIQVTFTARLRRRSDLELTLTSPSGTSTRLLTSRPYDYSRRGFEDWTILTMELWGERPTGSWELEVTHAGRRRTVELKEWTIRIYGTKEKPMEF